MDTMEEKRKKHKTVDKEIKDRENHLGKLDSFAKEHNIVYPYYGGGGFFAYSPPPEGSPAEEASETPEQEAAEKARGED